MISSDTLNNKHIFTVSELTSEIKHHLEDNFPIIWITGEISNFSMPGSGHFYFTLKDDKTQINAVMFKGQHRNLSFKPDNGMNITGLGRISVYEPRGIYQIIIEYLEPKGIGALQAAYEQLKTRLYEEGLFDNKYKSEIPFLPNKISIITSPSGAVIHDIIKIIDRRFPNVHLEIVPVKVQGFDAANEIVSAIELVNIRNNSDVIILARGGGSIEDLFPFNTESVARAIFESHIPVVSAVGHETDYTIADFVADLRAPTPSAAAEIVVPLKYDLGKQCQEIRQYLTTCFYNLLKQRYDALNVISKRIIHPKRKIDDLRLKIDDLTLRLQRICLNRLHQQKEHLSWRIERLFLNTPVQLLKSIRKTNSYYQSTICTVINAKINDKQLILKELNGRLIALGPMAILERGYSITRTIPGANIIKDSESVTIEQDLEILLAKGIITCRVKGKSSNGKKNI